MMTTAQDSQAYVDTHYIILSELAKLSGASEARVLELVEAKCIPPHAYEVCTQKTFISSFGEYTLQDEPVRYYHPKLIDWIEQAEILTQNYALSDVAKKIKTKFYEDIDELLGERPMPWPSGKEHVWDYLMDGTWSLCLKQFNVPDLVTKEVARYEISTLTEHFVKDDINSEEAEKLSCAIKKYDKVALSFSPHEVGESSRCLEVGKAIEIMKVEQEK